MTDLRAWESAVLRTRPLLGDNDPDVCDDPFGRATIVAERQARKRVTVADDLEGRILRYVLRSLDAVDDVATRRVLHCFDAWDNVALRLANVLTHAQPMHTRGDKRACVARLQAGARSIANWHRECRAALVDDRAMPSTRVLNRFVATMRALLADPPYRARLRAIATRRNDVAHADDVVSAVETHFEAPLARMLDDLADVDVAMLRRTDGLCGLRGGRATYARLVRHFTTLPRATAVEVHAYGKREVARLRVALRETSSSDASNNRRVLRGAAALEAYAETVRAARAALPARLRALAPGCNVLPTPAHAERTSPMGWYDEETHTFHVNLSLPHPARGVAPLAHHEAFPGHHLQIQGSRAPHARTLVGEWAAYEEGWAVYAETIMVRTPSAGAIESELMRACRLVVDTGLHAFGWTAREAREYMLDTLPTATTQDIANEVDRYCAHPGQALTYGMGLRVFRMVANAARMNADELHERIVREGPMPLCVFLARWGVQWERYCPPRSG